jgi:ferritin heavy chain
MFLLSHTGLSMHLVPAEGDLLADQADSVKSVAGFVAQLRRVGKGLGVYEVDRKLAADVAAAAP